MLKRSAVLILAALIVAAPGAISRGESDLTPGVTSSPLRGKTAYVNLTSLIKNYTKFQRFSTSARSQVEKIETKIKKLKADLDAQAKELSQPGIQVEDRQNGEKNARAIQRQIEDLTVEGRTVVGGSTESMMVEIYRDIRNVVAEYARREGLDAVLHYNDATAGTPEFFSPQNVGRKLQAGAAMPLYIAAGLDITEAIQTELNNRVKNNNE